MFSYSAEDWATESGVWGSRGERTLEGQMAMRKFESCRTDHFVYSLRSQAFYQQSLTVSLLFLLACVNGEHHLGRTLLSKCRQNEEADGSGHGAATSAKHTLKTGSREKRKLQHTCARCGFHKRILRCPL